jgi:hypothetical protein
MKFYLYPAMLGMLWVQPGLALLRIGSIDKGCRLKRYLLGRIFQALTLIQYWILWAKLQ